MKPLLLAVAGLIAMAMVACGGGATQVYVGKSVSGTITASDANEEGWKSRAYVIDVRGGVEYFIRLSSTSGNPMGIWIADADDYVVEISPDVTARTVAYTFSESGPQELFVRSPDSDVPSLFTFEVRAFTGT